MKVLILNFLYGIVSCGIALVVIKPYQGCRDTLQEPDSPGPDSIYLFIIRKL